MARLVRSLAVLLTFALGPAFAQSYFTSEPTDSPQLTALILDKPVRIPAEAGGGLLGIGRIAPTSFDLTGVKGTPYLLGSFDLPATVANWPQSSVYVIAEEKSRKVLALFFYGRESLEIFEKGRLGLAGPAGEQRWEEVGRDKERQALGAFSCERLFDIRRYSEHLLMRVAPGFDRLDQFPLFVGARLSFTIDARAYAALPTAPATLLPPFQVESYDSPQMLAFVQGKPFPIPDAMGGGFAEIGKPAPSSLPLDPMKGTPWHRGYVALPPPNDAQPGTGFAFFARTPDGPIEVIMTGGLGPLLLFESDRAAPPETVAVGVATESSPGEKEERHTLLATRFPHVVVAKGESFEGFYRLSPGLQRVEALPIGETTRVKLDLNRAAPDWIAAQTPLLASAWSAPLSPDWSTIETIRREALVVLGDKAQAEKVVTAPGAKLWSALPPSRGENKGPGRELLKRFGAAALKESYALEWFREIYEFSQNYPDTRPAGRLTEKLLERYDGMTVEKLLHRDYFGASEAPALTALRHAKRIDSPSASQADIDSFRFHIVHVMTAAEAATLLPETDRIWTRQLDVSPENALWARIARVALKVFPDKEGEVKWRIDVLREPKTSALRTTVAQLLAPLSEDELAATEANDLESQPGLALATFISSSENERYDLEAKSYTMAVLLFKLRHRPFYDSFQDALVRDLPPTLLAELVRTSVHRKEHPRLREAFAGRLRELERVQAQRGNYALAAVLAVNQAQLRGLAAPADRVSFLQLPKTASENPWERARFYVGKFIVTAYPPLEANLEESAKLHRMLTGSAEFAFTAAYRDLGITYGSLADYAAATRSAHGENASVVRLALSPPRFVPAAETATSPWTGHEHPLLASRWRDLQVAQRDVGNIGKTDAWAAHFYGTASSEQALQEVRARLAAARGTAQGYQGNVNAAATGLSNYEREKAALERNGIAVGRDPNRPDRVVTRELSSFENRSIATSIDNQKETLRRESAYQGRLNSEVAALEAQERELVSKISEYKGIANRSSFEYRSSSQRSLRDAEEAYRRAREEIGSLPDQGAAAQRNPVRFAALRSYRNRLWFDLPVARGEKETELYWRRWWLDNDYGAAPQDRGGATYPASVARPDAVESVWRYEFEQAFGTTDLDASAAHFCDGVAALVSALAVKPELMADLKSACQRLRAHNSYLPNRVLNRASGSTFKLLEPLLR